VTFEVRFGQKVIEVETNFTKLIFPEKEEVSDLSKVSRTVEYL
jgi:hypothetical protein